MGETLFDSVKKNLGVLSLGEIDAATELLQARATVIRETDKALEETLAEIETELKGKPEKGSAFIKGIPDYLKQIGYSSHTRPTRTQSKEEANSGYDYTRHSLEMRLLSLCDRLSVSERTAISAHGIMQKDPKIKNLVNGNATSFSRYLMTIRKKSEIVEVSYDRNHKTYAISFPLSYEIVAKAADVVHKRQNTVTIYDMQKEGVVGNPFAMARYLSRWGKARKTETEDLKLSKRQHCNVYFKGERPPMTPLEKFKAAAGNKGVVTHSYIKEETGLSNRSIYSVISQTGFESRGSDKNREYHGVK